MTQKELSALDPITQTFQKKEQITLRVPKIVKDRIAALARQQGATLNSYALHILISFLAKKSPAKKH